MTELIQEKKRALSGWPMIIGWVAMLIFAIHACTHMVGAGDTWVALACGRHFINHGVNTMEPFSANSHRPGPTAEEVKTWPGWAQWITDKVGLETVKHWHPTGWVNQNWLTHVIFYWLTTLSPFADANDLSFNTLVYLKFTIYILAVICIYCSGRLLGVNPALSAMFACGALFISRSFLDIRPAGFSNLLVAVFLLILVLATYRNHLYIWFIVPITIFWANVHGGYIYVFIMLVPVVVLRMLTMLSKRATVGVFSILTWLALYAIMFKDISHEPFNTVETSQSKLIFMLIMLVAGSIVLMLWKSVNAFAFYSYHIVVSIAVFLVLFGARLSPENMDLMTPDLVKFVTDAQVSFATAFFAAAALGVTVTLLKDMMTVTRPAAIWHTAGAGVAAFVASIIFNPFHITNLTHTFQISVSENAEGWRNVHEWWGAFRWDCPVGTAFPFMVMVILGGGLLVIWLGSRWLAPKVFKGPKAELESQQRFFNIAGQITGYLAAVLVCWALMVSLSMTDVSLAGFLLIGLFVGVLWASVFANVHWIYAVIPLSLFAIGMASKNAGYTNREIFPFITIPCYILLHAIGGQVSKKPRYSILNIVFVSAAAVVAMMLMLAVFNPFNFNFGGNDEPAWAVNNPLILTPVRTIIRLYTIITQPSLLWGIHRTWGAPYEANLDQLSEAYTYLYQALYFINAFCILAWVAWWSAPYVMRMFVVESDEQTTKEGQKNSTPIRPDVNTLGVNLGQGFQLPKIDLALITISALTVYMAIRSRRFIPIAAYMSCPVIAMFVQQIFETVSSSWNFHRKGRLAAGGVPVWVQWFLGCVAAVIVTGLGTFWGLKFYNIYLAPWPTETKLSSMFMRMTASGVKPFAACQFIVDNNMSGNMFNYWTEGGFIAWGQKPDPNTGRTPLQLFIDGRAQAAYNYDAYMRWNEIMSGGEFVQRARIRNQGLTPEDYKRVGEWINNQLKPYNDWVVLMPANQFDSPFVRGLEFTPNWRLVFMNDKEKLYVDITTKRGQEIFSGLEDGSTKYPDEASRNLMKAHNTLVYSTDPASVVKGLESAINSFQGNPSRTVVQLIQIYYERFPALRPKIEMFWKGVLDDFVANEKKYLNSNGYHQRMLAALIAMEYMRPAAVKENNKELLKRYEDEAKKLTGIMETLRYKGW